MKHDRSDPRKEVFIARINKREKRILNNIIDAVDERTGVRMTKTEVFRKALLCYANNLVIFDGYTMDSIKGRHDDS